ncbi:MAG: purine-nucleoside phosphorylase [Oscillospiraceae bacterium]|nr:purine-nucleoside phosphorylase [Oscillospiraceae bacterium]
MVVSSPSACIVADPEQIAKVVLFPGDPLRAKTVAETYLEDVVCFNTVRNMLGFTGTYKGKRISVMGSGMGVPSATLYLTELYDFFGVEACIRIGTAGGIASDIECRDLVIAMAAATNSAYGHQYEFHGERIPPVANYDMLKTADRIAEEKGVKTRVGSVFTTDIFYSVMPERNELLQKQNILAVEMETAGIYLTSQMKGKKALSLLSISDHVMTGEGLSAEDRQDSFREMMEIALETAWEFTE